MTDDETAYRRFTAWARKLPLPRNPQNELLQPRPPAPRRPRAKHKRPKDEADHP